MSATGELTSEEAALKAEADAHKDAANVHFKARRFMKAIDLYSKAIAVFPDAPYFANRSFAYLKTEAYGFAKEDAASCIKLNPKYVKGYYRRASANIGLGKFKLAVADLKTVVSVAPNDKDAKNRLKECEKLVRAEAFAKAIESEGSKSVLETTDWQNIPVEDSYAGPRLEGEVVTAQFVEDMMDHFGNQKMIHRKYVFDLLGRTKAHLMSQPSLIDVTIPQEKFTICGDIHGQYYDLLNIFKLNGMPSEANPYLFNGDFVDRGSFSLEVILVLFGWMLVNPKSLFMSRGNHESLNMNKMYGFDGEVKSKLNEVIVKLFHEVFNWLPLAHVIDRKVFCCHGGLFKDDGVTLDAIRKTHRNCEPPDTGIMCDLLWADPQPGLGRGPSKRGVGCNFGPDVTKDFLERNGLEYMVRSHEVKDQGYELAHDGKCITIFSAPNYCDTVGNKGAFINIKKGDLTPKFTVFDAVKHPNVKPMAYVNSMFSSMGLGF